MTDRDLLERAAKAYGLYEDWPKPEYGVQWNDNGLWCFGNGLGELWNPLEDDGDAFRLAVKLKIDLIHDDPQANDAFVMAGSLDHVEDVDGEVSRPAAARRAIVRAAAALAV